MTPEETAKAVIKLLFPEPYILRYCACGSAEQRPSCAMTSYAKPGTPEPPFCEHCGRWICFGQTQKHKNAMGLSTSHYIPSSDGHY